MLFGRQRTPKVAKGGTIAKHQPSTAQPCCITSVLLSCILLGRICHCVYAVVRSAVMLQVFKLPFACLFAE